MKIKNQEINDNLIKFAQYMQIELDDNKHKGNIFDWVIEDNFEKWLYEFEYHKAKLIAALMANDRMQAIEYASDMGNYLAALISRKENFNLQKSHTLTESNIKII